MKVVDLFSGLGGFSAGAIAAGAEVILGVDHDPVPLKLWSANVMAAVRKTLRKHLVSADVVSGEKRQRDAFSDLEDDPGLEAAMAGAEVQA